MPLRTHNPQEKNGPCGHPGKDHLVRRRREASFFTWDPKSAPSDSTFATNNCDFSGSAMQAMLTGTGPLVSHQASGHF
jgi:hypothetical protein